MQHTYAVKPERERRAEFYPRGFNLLSARYLSYSSELMFVGDNGDKGGSTGSAKLQNRTRLS